MRRILLCFALVLSVSPVQAAFAAKIYGWESMRTLSPGKTINVYTRTTEHKCNFVSADDTQLICRHGKRDTYTFSRTEILSVRLAYHPTYTIIGFLAGAGIGAGVGYAIEHNNANCNNSFCSGFEGLDEQIGTGIGAVTGAIGGGVGGFALDLGLRKTIYVTP